MFTLLLAALFAATPDVTHCLPRKEIPRDISPSPIPPPPKEKP